MIVDPRKIIDMAAIAHRPVVILGNGPQIDRLQAGFWDRLNQIQDRDYPELIVAGVNRIGIADACLKHKYKPDFLATVDKPFYRQKTIKDQSAEQARKDAEHKQEEREMSALKRTNPKAYEIWEASRNRLRDMEAKEAIERSGGKAEMVPTDVTDAFARSFVTCAGVSRRVVSQQATWFLQPAPVPDLDIVLNLDTSLNGAPNRAKMQFTTSDWLVNWFSRMGCREFYFYGTSMRDGMHCKTLGLTEDDDYSWTEPKRQATCFRCWENLKEAFPGLKLYNCDRKALFVEKGVMEFKTPPQLDASYALKSDTECTAELGAVRAEATRVFEPIFKAKREQEELARIKAQMEADQKRASA